MKKGDLVVELGDDSHIGVYCRRLYKSVLVRWHPKCATWIERNKLRLANPQEVVRYNSLRLPTLEQYASAL